MPQILTAQRDGVGSDGAYRPSEDRIAVLPNAVVLLDGATGTQRNAVTVTAYVDALLAVLARQIGKRHGADLATLLAAAISTVAAKYHLSPGESPSSTVAVVRWDESVVDVLVLGDSPVVVFTPDAVHPVADNRLATLRRAGRLRDTSAVRALRNVDGGFWVAEADPGAAAHALRRRWPTEGLRAVALASDGVSCGVDHYRLATWPQLLTLSITDGPDAVLDLVRAAERSDPGRTRWPRPKLHDDQALAIVHF